MTERRSRFQPDPTHRPFVLTERDQEVALTCWSYRWLTRQQLQRVLPLPGAGRTNDRLRKLFDAEILTRVRVGTVGAGLQPVYTAGEAAVPLIARATGLAEGRIRARLREDRRASAVLLPHDLQSNDLRIALTGALALREDLQLAVWQNAGEAFDAYAPGRSLRPDGYLQVRQGEFLHAFFVEVDRGTAGLASWAAKVARYVEYKQGGHYTRRHGLQKFRVLTATTSDRRLSELRAATLRVTDRAFWFARTDELLTDAAPDRTVWRAVGHEGLRVLLPRDAER